MSGTINSNNSNYDTELEWALVASVLEASKKLSDVKPSSANSNSSSSSSSSKIYSFDPLTYGLNTIILKSAISTLTPILNASSSSLSEKPALKVEKLEKKTPRICRLLIREGKKREVRRIFEAFGYEVVELCRLAFGPLQLGDLPSGRGRYLSSFEIRELRKSDKVR